MIAMKKNALKHYARKKFFYRFFVRKSPRAGAIYGLSWMLLLEAIIPITPWIFLQMLPLNSDLTNWDITVIGAGAFLFFGIFLLFYLYGFLTFAKNLYTLLRNNLVKSRWWKLPALLGACFNALAAILLLAGTIRKRCWLALICLLISLACVGTGYYLETPLQQWWSLLYGQTFFLINAIAAMSKNPKLPAKYFYPAFGFAILVAVLTTGDIYFQHAIKQAQTQLIQITGCGITAGDWQKRNDSGFPEEQEPLKSFCQLNLKIDAKKYSSPDKAKKYLAELRKTNPDIFTVVNKTLSLAPQRIAYKWVEPGDPVAALLLPDLDSFRTATTLRCLAIRADVGNKSLVTQCNNDLLKIREWCLINETLIGKLVAIGMEIRRLNTLSYIIADNTYSKSEKEHLIGSSLDWRQHMPPVFATEHAIVQQMFELLPDALQGDIKRLDLHKSVQIFWGLYQEYAPLFAQMNQKRDYLFALKYYIKISSLLLNTELSGLEKQKCAYLDEEYLAKECFIISRLMLRMNQRLPFRVESIYDVRQMALLAVEVMEYQRQHGKLPDNLDFITPKPITHADHKPFGYEITAEGFRIFTRDADGIFPPDNKSVCSYDVSLTK